MRRVCELPIIYKNHNSQYLNSGDEAIFLPHGWLDTNDSVSPVTLVVGCEKFEKNGSMNSKEFLFF